MTDLKELLEEAAGDDPLTTDTDLTTALLRGQRSLRRRRSAATVAAVTATAAVAGGVWSVLPGSGIPGTVPAPAGNTTTPVTVPATVVPSPSRPTKTARQPTPTSGASSRAVPVVLVPDGRIRAHTDLVCGLQPKGWKVRVYSDPSGMNESELVYTPAKPVSLGAGSGEWATLAVRHARFFREGGRMVVEKYSNTWDELPHVRAGDREAVVAPADAPVTDGNRDVHMRMSSTRLIQVTGATAGPGWDLPTMLRFAGSCRFAD